MMKTYTKDGLIQELLRIRSMGWMKSHRQGNHGGIGNTLEDLLGVDENNLAIPNCAEWEMKCHRIDSTSLITLFHCEPSPRAMSLVPTHLLPKYGWKHKQAGKMYVSSERSFRQTIHGSARSDRGFQVVCDRSARKILISFDATKVHTRHAVWLEEVRERAGLRELEPVPYWGFDDLFHTAGTKLLNCFYVQARVKRDNGVEYCSFERIRLLTGFSIDLFVAAIERGDVLVDFDARTGHNHGTKFRLRQDRFPSLYSKVEVIA